MMKVFFVVLCLSAFALATEIAPRGGSTSAAATTGTDVITCLVQCVLSLVAQITSGLIETIIGLLITLEGLLDTVIGTVISLVEVVTALALSTVQSQVGDILSSIKLLGFVVQVIQVVEQDLFSSGLLDQLVQTLFALPLSVLVALHQLTEDLVDPACQNGLAAVTGCIGFSL